VLVEYVGGRELVQPSRVKEESNSHLCKQSIKRQSN
jgi:hypothetical protein